VHDDKQRVETVREFSVVSTFSDSSEMFTTDAVDCAGGNCFSMNTAVAKMCLRSPETDSNVVRRAQANAERSSGGGGDGAELHTRRLPFGGLCAHHYLDTKHQQQPPYNSPSTM